MNDFQPEIVGHKRPFLKGDRVRVYLSDRSIQMGTILLPAWETSRVQLDGKPPQEAVFYDNEALELVTPVYKLEAESLLTVAQVRQLRAVHDLVSEMQPGDEIRRLHDGGYRYTSECSEWSRDYVPLDEMASEMARDKFLDGPLAERRALRHKEILADRLADACRKALRMLSWLVIGQELYDELVAALAAYDAREADNDTPS